MTALGNKTDAAEVSAAALALASRGEANCANCKNLFMQFSRKCRTKELPIALGPELQADQLNLFNQWLVCGKNMKSLEVIVTQKSEKSDESEQLWETMKLIDLEKIYTPEKVKAIVTKKDKLGHYDVDPEFPTDPKERSYWLFRKSSFARKNKIGEGMEVKGTKDLDEDEAHALVDVGGVLGPGATVAVPGMGIKSQESLMEEIYAQGDEKPASKKRQVVKKDPTLMAGPPEEMKPVTLKDQAPDVMPKLLDDASQAQKHLVALPAVGLSQESQLKLQAFSDFCHKAYKKCQKLMIDKTAEDAEACQI